MILKTASAFLLLAAATAAAQDDPAPTVASPGAPSLATPKIHDFVPRPIPREPKTVPPPAEISTALDTFFKGLEQNEVRKSYANLLAGTRLAAREEDLNTFVDKTQQALAIYGKMNDFEVYDTRTIGTRLLVTTYFTALTVSPLRWRFIYYKPVDKWVLINLVFDDSMQDLLE